MLHALSRLGYAGTFAFASSLLPCPTREAHPSASSRRRHREPAFSLRGGCKQRASSVKLPVTPEFRFLAVFGGNPHSIADTTEDEDRHYRGNSVTLPNRGPTTIGRAHVATVPYLDVLSSPPPNPHTTSRPHP